MFLKTIRTSHFSVQAESDARLISEITYPLVEEFPSEAGSISVDRNTFVADGKVFLS